MRFAFLLGVALVGCGSSSTTPGKQDGGSGDSSTIIPTDVGCADDTKLVWVMSRDSYLYKFDPPSGVFTSVGRIDCFNGGAEVFSMTVDRKGFVYILYTDESIYRVNPADRSCNITAFPPAQLGFSRFGMAFSSDTPGGPESLYASDLDGKGLARIDAKSYKLSYVGPYDGPVAGRAAALSGTGDGRLFGFFTTDPARVGEIDKKSGHVTPSAPLTGVKTGTDWAFAFWGGDFWLFTADQGTGLPQQGQSTKVTRYRPNDGSLTVTVPSAGFFVVGAGVSTCAPVTAPQPK